MVDKKYLKIGFTVFLFYLIIYYWSKISTVIGVAIGAAMPLLVGVIIAYIINILMSYYERQYFSKSKSKFIKASRRPICILLAIFTVIIIVAAVFCIVLPEFKSSIELLLAEVPKVLNKAYQWVINNEQIRPYLDTTTLNTQIDWQKTVKDVVDVIVAGAGGVMNSAISIASSLFSFAGQALIGFIFALYLLIGKEKLMGQMNNVLKVYLKPHIYNKVNYVAKVANSTFKSFIVGQCTEAVIIGALCAVGMMIFRFPYAGMTGAVVGITALIPVAGAYIGAAIGAFMICTVNPMQALFFIVYLVILQQLEGNLIYPRVVGTSIGLPGMWVLAAVTISGGLFGITGMLFGVPCAAVVYKLLKADVNKKLQKQSLIVEEKVSADENVLPEEKMAEENVTEVVTSNAISLPGVQKQTVNKKTNKKRKRK